MLQAWSTARTLAMPREVRFLQSRQNRVGYPSSMILVTGGMGFIGLHTARALREAGARVMITRHRVERMPDFLRGDPEVVVEPLDVGDAGAFARLGDRHRIEGIVHLAAHLGAGDPIDAARGALASIINVLDAARSWRVKRVTFASTIGVYAGVRELPYREDAALPIASPHFIPCVKKTWEITAAQIAGRIGVEAIALRLGGFWGPLKTSRNAMPSLLAHAAARGEPVDLGQLLFDEPTADGGYDMIYAEDGARAIATLQLADRLVHRAYNVGAGRITRNRELLAAVGELVPGFAVELPAAAVPRLDAEHLDITRLQGLGWAPRFDVRSGMERYLAWLRAGNPW